VQLWGSPEPEDPPGWLQGLGECHATNKSSTLCSLAS
jgi:hypothetical protein